MRRSHRSTKARTRSSGSRSHARCSRRTAPSCSPASRDRARAQLRPRSRGVRANPAGLSGRGARARSRGRRGDGARSRRGHRQADARARAPLRACDRRRAARRDAGDPRARRAGGGGAAGTRRADPAAGFGGRRSLRGSGVPLVRERRGRCGDRARASARRRARRCLERARREPCHAAAAGVRRLPRSTAGGRVDVRRSLVCDPRRPGAVRRRTRGVGLARPRARPRRAARQRALGQLDREPAGGREGARPAQARRAAARGPLLDSELGEHPVGGPAVIYDAAAHEPLTDTAWDEEIVGARVDAIVADAESALRDAGWPNHPLDDDVPGEPLPQTISCLYLGSAGMVWALHALGSRLDLTALADAAIERYRANPDLGDDVPSLWVGESGLQLLARTVGGAFDAERLRARIRENMRNETWELMWGSPGTILAARVAGFEGEWRESCDLLVGQWDRESGLWTQNLYGSVVRFVGPAHGFVGNVHALRGALPDAELRVRVEPTLRRL